MTMQMRLTSSVEEHGYDEREDAEDGVEIGVMVMQMKCIRCMDELDDDDAGHDDGADQVA